MRKDIQEKVEKLNIKHRNHNIWLRIMSILACITVFVTTYALILPAITLEISDSSYASLDLTAQWNNDTNKIEQISISFTAKKNWTYTLQKSADNGLSWTDTTYNSEKIKKTGTFSFTSGIDEPIENMIQTPWGSKLRVLGVNGNNTTYTVSFTADDVFEAIKPGFRDWLDGSYCQDFGGLSLPQNYEEMCAAFDIYFNIPTATLTSRTEADYNVYADVSVDAEGIYTYAWEYQDASGAWVSLTEETGATILTNNCPGLLNGGSLVQCKVYDENGNAITVSNRVFINPLQQQYEDAVTAINDGLGLYAYPVPIYDSKGGLEELKTILSVDLSIGGTEFTNYFYYEKVAADPDVPFSDAESYTNYLARTYLSYENPDDGLAAVQKIWERYLYDLFDPIYQSKGFTHTPDDGDGDLSWHKDDFSSFHSMVEPVVKDLNYDFLEDGIDYSNFITGLDKTASALAAGDGNVDRKYDIEITADAQAKADAPIAIIFQIQSTWQMFDMQHANALKKEGNNTSVGAVAKNDELATLYDIKQAMLQFVDYIEQNYKGNNIVLGITEVQHGDSQTMFAGTDTQGNTLYVTNDFETLRQGLYGWDIFGNCEHVHYDTDMLVAAVNQLASNLIDWKDFYGEAIKYEDIQKVAVVIGGPTENQENDRGFACTLPWSVFRDKKFNSVYSIRTNNGTPLDLITNKEGVISWIDYSSNNKGEKFNNGTGDTFTQKFVATSEDAIFDSLVEILHREMRKGGIELKDDSKFVDDVTVSDVVTNEFVLDKSEPITLTIVNKQWLPQYQTIISLVDETVSMAEYQDGVVVGTVPLSATFEKSETADGMVETTVRFRGTVGGESFEQGVTINENADGTARVGADFAYDFGKVFNTTKAILKFRVVAREDYLGSNNVYTNVGRPDLSYRHYEINSGGELTGKYNEYYVDCFDTPQVNVPIRFSTVDGETANIKVGSHVDLASLSSAIATDAEQRVDNYPQTNGTLTYVWVLPDGTQLTVGSVDVTNGTIEEMSFPDRSYDFIGEASGNYEAILQITFTPEEVDPKNENFSNTETKVPVNELNNSGKVWINVYEDSDSRTIRVRKNWVGQPPDGISQVDFYLLANGERTRDGTGDEVVYTLSSENGWEMDIPGLPVFVDGNFQSYTVEEIPVDGYVPSYETTIDVVDSYSASLNISFTISKRIDSGKKVRITFIYNGETRYYEFTTAQRYYAGSVMEVEVSGLEANGQLPYDGYSVTDLQVYKGDGKNFENGPYHSEINVTANTYVSGTTEIPVFLIKNTPSYELPATGGCGILPFILGGTVLMLPLLVYGYRRRRKRERRINT